MTLFLQSAADPMTNMFFMLAMLFVFVFLIILPQRRRRREQKAFMDNLSKGDEVVTSSGFLGRISKIEDHIVTLDMGNKTFFRITRNAISKELTDAIYPPKKDK